MLQNKNIILALLLILILVISGSIFFNKSHVFKNKITGTVTRVVDKPNQAEDGYYGFDISDSSGQKYTINATGYLNTPLSPESANEVCVDVPKVKTGDKVEFNLPESHDQPKTFYICYKNNLTDYYFKLN